MTRTHLSDDRLIELYFTGTPSAREQLHLGECVDCERRRADASRLLEETARAAAEDVDAAFPAARLARQQAEILSRVEDVTGPARVIAFPNAQPAAAMLSSRVFATSRWVAAAAIAGLVVGLVAGRAGRERPSGRAGLGPAAGSEPVIRRGPGIQPASATMSDDQFLVELETARQGPLGALRPLDRLTP